MHSYEYVYMSVTVIVMLFPYTFSLTCLKRLIHRILLMPRSTPHPTPLKIDFGVDVLKNMP